MSCIVKYVLCLKSRVFKGSIGRCVALCTATYITYYIMSRLIYSEPISWLSLSSRSIKAKAKQFFGGRGDYASVTGCRRLYGEKHINRGESQKKRKEASYRVNLRLNLLIRSGRLFSRSENLTARVKRELIVNAQQPSWSKGGKKSKRRTTRCGIKNVSA